jgi:choice-of-anchor A domain-containing protein
MFAHHLDSRSFVVAALVALFVACTGGQAVDSEESATATGDGATGSVGGGGSTSGLGGAPVLSDAGNGSGADGAGSTGASDGSGSTGASDGSGSTGASDGSGSTGASDGSGSTGSGTAGAGVGGADSGTAGSGNEAGRTYDVGSGGDVGAGGTFDVGSGGTLDLGSGGTLDLGSGGTLDLGSGGTLDLGSGGTIDLGTGGTLDTCTPTCGPGLLGEGEEAVNLVVFNDATAGGCDTEGRMWVGGNANLSGYGVGAQLADCDADGYVLVVGGNLSVTGGINGRIWVGGDLEAGTTHCGGVWSSQPPPVDFAEVQATLTAYSRLLMTYPVNGTISRDGAGATVFTGTDDDINVFVISSADFTSANGFVVDVPVTSTVIVNVTGTTAEFVNGKTTLPDGVTCGSGAVQLDDFCNQVIWNFPEATSVSVSGTAVQGSILAPLADFGSNGSGQVNGTVIVNNFDLTACVEMHPHYFNGCLCVDEVDSPYACCI